MRTPEIKNPNVKPFKEWTTKDVLRRTSSSIGSENLLVKKEDTPECDRAYPVIRKGKIFTVQTFGVIIIALDKEMEKVGELPTIDERTEK